MQWFIAGHFCVGPISSITHMKLAACGQEVNVTFVDLTKAYDHVPITRIWKELK